MAIVRVFVVDDSRLWQDYVRRHLLLYPHMQIVGTETDGLAAVGKAQELQPDLILLDVHLPGLNGIEAALRIRNVAPKSAILFVSGDTDLDIVRAAFKAGGNGYILKYEAAVDLSLGMEAALLGKRFISRSLGKIEDLT